MNIYSSGSLVLVVESLENKPLTFFRDRFFTKQILSTDEKVYFDKVSKKRRIAPFVSPLVKGKVMELRGFNTDAFEPGYVKPKTPIDPNAQFKRTVGEKIGGSLTPAERRNLAIRQALQEHEEALSMREEVMCAEILLTGKLTIEGEGFGTVVLDFGRDTDLTDVEPDVAWDADGADPLGDIEAWALLVRQTSNAIVRDVVCAPDAFAALKASLTDVQIQALLVSPKSNTKIEMGPATAEKFRYEGTIGQFNFWTYSDTYQDESGTDQELVPSGAVLLVAGEVEGVRCYGAIRDPRAGFQAVRNYPKNWIEEDPAMEWVMSQSAPLMVPSRIDATLNASVLT